MELVTERLLRRDRRHDGSDCACASMSPPRRCITELLPVQAWALWEIRLAGGLLGDIGVGQGKTGLDFLAAMVVPGCRHAALLLPPERVEQLVADYEAWREHFRVPTLVVGDRHWFQPAPAPVLRVVPYSRLSRPEATTLLDELRLDTVIADEAQNLRGRAAARTKRFIRLYLARPDTRLCAWSGSITSRSLTEFAHLAALSLGEGSPLPLDPDEVERWAAAVDASEWPAPPGALTRLMASTGQPEPRGAVRVRFTETLGVVSTADAVPCPASIVIRERRPPPAPAAVREAMLAVRRTWTRPDGEEMVEAPEVARCLREISSGFYYRWLFPDDPAADLVAEWFDARKGWHRELREKLSHGAPHLDSPFLCAAAAERGRRGLPGSDGAPAWRARTWARWADVKDAVRHETEAVWIDEWLARDAAEWLARTAREGEPGVVWYSHDAFGAAVSRASGLPAHSGGGDEPVRRAAASGSPLVLSIRAYGTGFDGLQHGYSRALVANPPSSGDAWEQLIGRLHRRGQLADEVAFETYRHTPEVASAVDRAIVLAKYVEGVTGKRQALLAADVEWRLERESWGAAA